MNQDKNQNIDELKKIIAEAEADLEAAKKALYELTGEQPAKKPLVTPSGMRTLEGGTIIEGFFDGENMVGPEGKIFPVPANYASKSKLVEGDKLKLTIAEDGSFIFKQIGPIERKSLVGELLFENNAYSALVDGKAYNLLYASVTYFKAKPGDKITVVVPAAGDSKWAAFENVIHETAPQSTSQVQNTPVIESSVEPTAESRTEATPLTPDAQDEPTTNDDFFAKMEDAGEKPFSVAETQKEIPEFPNLDATAETQIAPEVVPSATSTSVAEAAPPTDNFFDAIPESPVAPLPAPQAQVAAAPAQPIKELDI